MTTIAVTDGTDPGQEAAIRALLSAFNAEHGWEDRPAPFQVVLKDDAGVVQGGVLARANWRWLWVMTLAVAPALRGQGHGARLLAAAEAHAVALGCVGVRLDTYSFQARAFYEKQGYAMVGAIAGCPPGQTRFSMIRRLVAEPAEPWPEAAAPRATISHTDAEFEPAQAVIEAGLTAHNMPFGGHHGFRPINLVVRRPGAIAPVGGLLGFVLYRWFHVRELFLPEDLRRGGLGAALLARAEAAAARAGCVGVWLDTFAFQARPFYEKQGYRLFGSIPECPPGHARHYMMKRLDGAEDSA